MSATAQIIYDGMSLRPAVAASPASEDLTEVEGPPEAVDAQEAPQRPAKDALKADWVDYAEALGVDIPDDATKQDIIDLTTDSAG